MPSPLPLLCQPAGKCARALASAWYSKQWSDAARARDSSAARRMSAPCSGDPPLRESTVAVWPGHRRNATMAFELPPLPYDYSALEPYIDEQTMHLPNANHPPP